MKVDLEAAQRLAEQAKARAEASSHGPWRRWGTKDISGFGNEVPRVAQLGNGGSVFAIAYVVTDAERAEKDATAEFIAAARSDVPALADLVIYLIERVQKAEGWHPCNFCPTTIKRLSFACDKCQTERLARGACIHCLSLHGEDHYLTCTVRFHADLRCPVCDWAFAESSDKGCVPGNCSYRPDDPTEQERIRIRLRSLSKI